MRITPLDVRKQEFRKSVRGFDCDEVRAFLTTLADEYEAVLVDNKVLRERFQDQDTKISEYQTMERTLRDTLMTAERVMQESKENAAREGDLVIQEAQLTAKGILEECRVRTEELRRELISLRKEKETYLARFKGLAEAQITFIESHKDDFADLDRRLIDMADSVVDSGIQTEKTTTSVPITTKNTDFSTTHTDQWRDYTPISPVKSASKNSVAAAVDFAVMGIPVPAISAGESTDTELDVMLNEVETECETALT